MKLLLDNFKDSKGIVTADSDGQHTIKDVISIGKVLNELDSKSLILGTRNFNLKQVPLRQN